MRILIALIILAGCSTLTEPHVPPAGTTPAVKPVKHKKVIVWSTVYYAPLYNSSVSGDHVRDKAGESLGVKLTTKDLCNLMLQGGGYIDGQIYGWGGVNNINSPDCSAYYSRRAVSGNLKFKKDTHVRGVRNYKLTPFKSIAVDQSVIPYGSKCYIPSFNGIKYTDNGVVKTHDGIVWALDTGNLITQNHIDFYVGAARGGIISALKKARPFKTVQSTSSVTFELYIMEE